MALDKAERNLAIATTLFVYPYLLRDLVAKALKESEAKEALPIYSLTMCQQVKQSFMVQVAVIVESQSQLS